MTDVSTVIHRDRAPRLSLSRAHAARRASIAVAGLIAGIAAHVASSGGLDVLPIAPALWAMLIVLVAVVGTRRAPFQVRGAGATLALVVVSQAAIHVAMVGAPWAFGLRIHHADTLVTPGSAIAHVVATVLLVALVLRFDRLLGVLTRVVRAALATAPAPPAVPWFILRLSAPPVPSWRASGLHRASLSRGPPLPA